MSKWLIFGIVCVAAGALLQGIAAFVSVCNA